MKKSGAPSIFYFVVILIVSLIAIVIGYFITSDKSDSDGNQTSTISDTTVSFEVLSALILNDTMEIEIYNNGEEIISGFLVYLFEGNKTKVSEEFFVFGSEEIVFIPVREFSSSRIEKIQVVPGVVRDNRIVYLFENAREFVICRDELKFFCY